MILVFDVNATLLNLAPLRSHFEKWFGNTQIMGEWFGLMLRHTLVATITRAYEPFNVLGKDALRMTAKKYSVDMSPDDIDSITGQILELPPHPEVKAELARLKDAGYRLVTLTNSPPQALAAQFEYAGLTDFFEHQFTVDAVKLFKPAPETYHHVADLMGVPIGETRMIAAHNWDVTGAIRAGAKAAFIERPGMLLGESDEMPDVVGSDLTSVADQLLAQT